MHNYFRLICLTRMNTVQTEFDVIVIGGGINGLTTAAYCAKVGLKTVVIEKRDQVGTHAATEEWSVSWFSDESTCHVSQGRRQSLHDGSGA